MEDGKEAVTPTDDKSKQDEQNNLISARLIILIERIKAHIHLKGEMHES